MLKLLSAVAILVSTVSGAHAQPQSYWIDTDHSQVTFTFNHHGFSAVNGILTGITGDIIFDKEQPAQSNVTAQIPLSKLTTGHAEQDRDILSTDFLDAGASPVVTFQSGTITVVGANRALINGNLTLNGVTKPVVLDTVLNKDANSMKGVPTLGLHATTTLLRSDFGAGRSAPNNSDLIEIHLAIEASAGQ